MDWALAPIELKSPSARPLRISWEARSFCLIQMLALSEGSPVPCAARSEVTDRTTVTAMIDAMSFMAGSSWWTVNTLWSFSTRA